MSEVKLSKQQEAFAQEIIKGKTQADAYRIAYPTSKKWKVDAIYSQASILMNNSKVKLRLKELRKEKKDIYSKKHCIFLSEQLVDYLNEEYGELQDISDTIEEKLSELLSEDKQKDFKRSRTISPTTRYSVLKKAGFKCQACGNKPNAENDIILHIDHIVPFSLGGKNIEDNLQVLCNKCNCSKGNRYEVNHND